jgi:endonuclease/exonuclease/phosphatase family metal-dependent hydrolase
VGRAGRGEVSRGAARIGFVVVLVCVAVLSVVLIVRQPASAPAAAPAPPTAVPTSAAPAKDLRVMTWNVLTNTFDAPDWAPVVAQQAPDVVAFQEICAGDAKQLADLLRTEHGLDYQVALGPARKALYETCDPTPETGDVVFGEAVLSRVPLRDGVTTALPDPAGLDEPRAYLSVTLDVPGAAPIRLLTTHITIGRDTGDDDAKSARRRDLQGQQIATVARAAGSAGDRVLLLGDFNVGPGDPRMDPVAQAGLHDVDEGRNSPTGGNDYEKPGSAADAKIDYVFGKGLEQIGTPQTSWVPTSDHRPLVATLRP